MTQQTHPTAAVHLGQPLLDTHHRKQAEVAVVATAQLLLSTIFRAS